MTCFSCSWINDYEWIGHKSKLNGIGHANTSTNITGRVPKQKRGKRMFLQRSLPSMQAFEVMLFNNET